MLGLVISNVFACKTNSVFSDFVDFCVTAKRNRTGRAFCKTGELVDTFAEHWSLGCCGGK